MTLPPALTEQYIVTGIVIFVVFSVGVAFWAVMKEFRKWQTEESEKMRQWQGEQSAQWRSFLTEQRGPVEDLAQAINTLTTRVEVGFTKVMDGITAHDERVEDRIEKASSYTGVERRRIR